MQRRKRQIRKTYYSKRIITFAFVLALCLTGCGSAKQEKAEGITTIAELAGKRVASNTGGLFALTLDEQADGVQHMYFNDVTSQLEAVESGQADATLLDEPVAQLAVAQHKDLMILEEKLSVDEYGFAFRKGDPLAKEASRVIEQFREDGTLDEMAAKWFGEDESVKSMPELTYKADFDGSAGLIQFGHDGAMVPMGYIGEDGQSKGYDVELAVRIAYELNMQIQLTNMSFDALLISLSSGKSDMVGGCISISEERKKSVDFSTPYYMGGIVAVAKKSGKPIDEAKITELADLSGKKVVVTTGSILDKYLDEVVDGVEYMYLNDIYAQLAAVENGQADAVLLDEPVAKLAVSQHPKLMMLGEEVKENGYGFAFRKGDSLEKEASRVITQLRKDGTLDEMEAKWFGVDETVKTLPELTYKSDFDGSAGILRFGFDGAMIPMSYMGDGGEARGFDVELAMRIAYELNMQIQLNDMSFDALLISLTSGKSDMVGGCMSITEERKKSVDFCTPYYVGGVAVVIRKSANPVSELPSLETAHVGVMTGSTGETLLAKNYKKTTISSFDSFSDAVAALVGGKLDYVLGSYTSMTNYTKNNKALMLMPETIGDDANAIAFEKGNRELVDKVNLIIDQLEADGTLADMEKRWLKTENTPYELAKIPKCEDGQVLRVAISADREPICFVQDGEYVGFDCELIERIAYELGMRVEYQNMKFAGLLTSLQSGKSDLVISNLSYTEERTQSVDFSRTYFDNPQILLAKKPAGTENIIPWHQWFAENFNKTFVIENRYQLILQGLGTTMLISLLSVLFGTILGFGICMLRRSKRFWLNIPAKMFIRLIQGIPVVVILMILFYLVFTSPDINPIMVAVIGFSINFAAYVSEMMRTGIDAVDKGQLEAASAIGFNRLQVFYRITFPQAARHVLPVFKGEFISMIKMTSVVGYIAIQDLTKMSDIIRSRTFEAFFPLISTALIYFILSYFLTLLLTLIEMKIDPIHRKRIVKGVK